MIQPVITGAEGTNSVSTNQREEDISDRTNNLIDENLPLPDFQR